MPVYTYRCEECGIQFDQHQKFSDDPLTVCPECGQEALKKVYHPVGIVFKGSGFYATDHHSPSGQKITPSSDSEKAAEAKAESSAGKENGKESSKGEAKESKPATNGKKEKE